MIPSNDFEDHHCNIHVTDIYELSASEIIIESDEYSDDT